MSSPRAAFFWSIRTRAFSPRAPSAKTLLLRPFVSSSKALTPSAGMSGKDSTIWSDISKSKPESDGSYQRQQSAFRNVIAHDGKYKPERDRYHLYVSYACPWATRTLIFRKLKGLEDLISVTVVSPRMGQHGWPFASVDPFPGAEVDRLYNAQYIKDLYHKSDPSYEGRFTVPVLWDKKTDTIVNNESSEIIRMFNSVFDEFLPEERKKLDFYPAELKEKIDELNGWIYQNINNGVYRAGFAGTQEVYEKCANEVFDALDKVEKILEKNKYLLGDRLTEADVRLWVTVVRFDPVYFGHFKCNVRNIRDGYPNVNRWMKKLYWENSAFKEATDFNHIKTHYYWSHTMINPRRIVPVGPVPNILPL